VVRLTLHLLRYGRLSDLLLRLRDLGDDFREVVDQDAQIGLFLLVDPVNNAVGADDEAAQGEGSEPDQDFGAFASFGELQLAAGDFVLRNIGHIYHVLSTPQITV
jgi:hypothetical protein